MSADNRADWPIKKFGIFPNKVKATININIYSNW